MMLFYLPAGRTFDARTPDNASDASVQSNVYLARELVPCGIFNNGESVASPGW